MAFRQEAEVVLQLFNITSNKTNKSSKASLAKGMFLFLTELKMEVLTFAALLLLKWPRSTMDSIRVSEAPDPGSIPGEATTNYSNLLISTNLCIKIY